MKSKTAHVSKKKVSYVKELSELLDKKRTVLIASIKNIPASQFQEISKKLREKAVIKVPKKNLINKVFNESKEESIHPLKEQIGDSIAVVFSDLDPFDLALDFMQSRVAAKAKPGQIAPEDIEIPAGPTDLPPGPAISELGALGVQVQMEKGKISIKQAKVIAKAGEKISKGAAEMMGKLDIKPFKVGFVPLAAYDTKDKKMYLEIKIDQEEAVEDLRYKYGKALALAVQLGYTSEDTIRLLLGKAVAQANRINRIMTGEPEPEVAAPAVSETQPETKEEKEEEHASSSEGLASLFG